MEVYLVTYAVFNDPVCSSEYIEKIDSSDRNFGVHVESARTDQYNVEATVSCIMSVRLSAWDNSAPTERIFIKSDI